MNQFMLIQSNFEAGRSQIEAFHKNLEASNKDIEASNKNIEVSMKNVENHIGQLFNQVTARSIGSFYENMMDSSRNDGVEREVKDE